MLYFCECILSSRLLTVLHFCGLLRLHVYFLLLVFVLQALDAFPQLLVLVARGLQAADPRPQVVLVS